MDKTYGKKILSIYDPLGISTKTYSLVTCKELLLVYSHLPLQLKLL